MDNLRAHCQTLLGRNRPVSEIEMFFAVETLQRVLDGGDLPTRLGSEVWITPLCQAVLMVQLMDVEKNSDPSQRAALESALGLISRRVATQGSAWLNRSAVRSEQQLIDYVFVEMPGLRRLLYDGEYLQAALRLKHFVAVNVLEAPQEFQFESDDLGFIFRAFWDRTGGAWCGGAAKTLCLLLDRFNIPSVSFNFGLAGTELTHVIVAMLAEDGHFYLIDPYYSMYYADSANWAPLPLKDIFEHIAAGQHSRVRRVFQPFTRKRIWKKPLGEAANWGFEPYQLDGAEWLNEEYSVMPYKYPNERQVTTRLVEEHAGEMKTEDFQIELLRHSIGRDHFKVAEVEQAFAEMADHYALKS